MKNIFFFIINQLNLNAIIKISFRFEDRLLLKTGLNMFLTSFMTMFNIKWMIL
jgi:hypothetical protein